MVFRSEDAFEFDGERSLGKALSEMPATRKAALGALAVLVVGAAVAIAIIGNPAHSESFALQHDAEDPTEAPEEAGEAQSQTVFIHIVGCVENPGLYEVDKGSRVADVVEAAGGFTQDAATSACNLARIVSDGEQIAIPAQAELDAGADAPTEGVPPVQTASSGLVNINNADASELTALPGIGQATADKIVADRTANGRFDSIEDLKRVSGIGDKKYESLKDLICV